MEQREEHFQRIFNSTFDANSMQMYQHKMDFILAVNIALTCLLMWLLIWKTPPTMRQYRWYLLYLGLLDFSLDIAISLVSRPTYVIFGDNFYGMCTQQSFYPSIGWYGTMLLWLWIALSSCMVLSAASLAMIFRYFSLKDQEHLLFSKKAIFLQFIAQILHASPSFIEIFLLSQNAKYRIENEPELKSVLSPFLNNPNNSCAFIANSRFDGAVVILYAITTISIFMILFFKTDRTLRDLRSQISVNSYKYQRDLLRALILQFSIPVIFIVIALMLMYIPLEFEITTDKINLSRISFPMIALHTTANDLAMIYLIKPYRRAVLIKIEEIFVTPFNKVVKKWKTTSSVVKPLY